MRIIKITIINHIKNYSLNIDGQGYADIKSRNKILSLIKEAMKKEFSSDK